jgi:hypothetical protein
VLAQAARLQARQRFFNLVVTNVPGPQMPLYVLGRELIDLFPMAPLANKLALCIAVMSYNGRLNFGLLGDYDALPDMEGVVHGIEQSLDELREAAGIERPAPATAVEAAARAAEAVRANGNGAPPGPVAEP